MVRYGIERDIARVVELAREEHARSPWASVPFEADTAEATIRGFMADHGKTLMVTPGGYLMGLVQPLGFTRKLAAMEYALYANDGTGLQLVRQFIRWSKNMGAIQTTIHSFANEPRLERVLAKRMKFQPLGAVMALDLRA